MYRAHCFSIDRLIYFVLFFILFLIPPVHAQAPSTHTVDHKPQMNKVWEVFDQLMYKVEKKNGATIYTPHFPPALKALNGKKVTIQGYMVPIGTGRRHNVFLLSVLPVFQCMFCGQNGIPAMTEISMDEGKKIVFSDEPISITGTVYLNAQDKDHTEIQLRGAALSTP